GGGGGGGAPPSLPPSLRPPWVKFPRAVEGPGQPRTSSQLRREPSRRRGEAQSVHSAAPLSPGLAPPDCAPCSPQIKYTGFRDRPHEERQARFQNACRDGRSEIAFVATGTNLSLQFFPASWQGEQRQTPTREYVDFEREGGKVYLKAPMILNGVCVIWKGWIDLQRLDGMGCLEFDEERAQVRQSALGYSDICLFFWRETVFAFTLSTNSRENLQYGSSETCGCSKTLL
uniref:Core-binding factor subunit beta n=1 Tax=Zonotrichia albicollis TaxID=44394 RepID=A0A8D2MXP4_ZONAL